MWVKCLAKCLGYRTTRSNQLSEPQLLWIMSARLSPDWDLVDFQSNQYANEFSCWTLSGVASLLTCVNLFWLLTSSYLLPLWSPASYLQQASGNKGMSAHWSPLEVPLGHSDRTSCLPPSTSASPVWPAAGNLRVRSCSPCTCPPNGNSWMNKSIRQ